MEVVVRRATAVEKVVDPTIDLGNLLLIDNEPFVEETEHNPEDLLTRARDNTQLLFNSIWELSKERVEDAIVAALPAPTYRIPREKPVPEDREPTKWEAYAKEKGIVKRKKAKKEYDEVSGEWKPTYGYRRGKDDTKDWLIEVPDHKDPNKDYYEERIQKKKERIAKNETQRLKNIGRQMSAKEKGKAPPVDRTSLGVGKDAQERNKQELRLAADRAKVATASVGKFQEKLKLEKPNTKTGIKRKFEPNIGPLGNEKERNKNILEKLSKKKTELHEDKIKEVAGKEEGREFKKKAGADPPRQKSQIHRQQYFQKKLKDSKKTRGGLRPEGKVSKKAAGGGGGRGGKGGGGGKK